MKSLLRALRTEFALILLLLVVLWGLVVVALYEPVASWLGSEDRYDRDSMVEWLEETRTPETLPEMVEGYLKALADLHSLPHPAEPHLADEPALTKLEKAALECGS